MILDSDTRDLVESLKADGQMDAAALIEMLEAGFAKLTPNAKAVLANEKPEFESEFEAQKEKAAADTACEVVMTCQKSVPFIAAITEDTLMCDLFPDAFEVPNRWSELKTLLFKETA
jgi:carbamoylphosphate synthase small subunit